jgi:23S rRNA (pseudouridine1915-N3)-methyltransferase
MIVPSIHLVKQGVEDFKQYKEFFQTETVWAKGESCSCANLTIGTYQSLVQKADKKSKKYNPKFFEGYDIVCVDEAHHLVAKSINTILGLDFMKFVKLRFGFTGTLPQAHSIDAFACHSLMGPKIQNVTTMELVDRGFLAKPIINQIRIEYEDNEELLNNYIKCGEYLNSSYKEEEIVKDKEFELLLQKFDKNSYVIALDLHGKQYDSVKFAEKIDNLMSNSITNISFIIGGSLGWSSKMNEVAKEKLKLSEMTFTHQMTRVILLEQIYRSFKILRNETYHK